MALITNADVPCRQWVLAGMLLQPAVWKEGRQEGPDDGSLCSSLAFLGGVGGDKAEGR